MDVDIKFDRNATVAIQRWAEKQVRFATAKSLTRVAQASQVEVQKRIVKEFNTTKKWWSKGSPTGIKIKMAKTNNLEAEVFTGRLNTWLHRHEFGKARMAKGRSLVIPAYKKSMGSPDKADPKFSGIKPATWKKAKGVSSAIAKWGKGGSAKRKYPKVFMGKKARTKGMVFIKRKAGDGRPKLLFTTHLRTTKPMRKRLRMRETIEHTVEKQFPKIWAREIASAIASGK